MNMITSKKIWLFSTEQEKLVTVSEEGWSGSAMVLGKLSVLGCPTIWMTVGQGPVVLAVGVCCLDIFTLVYPISPLSPSLGDSPI